MGKIEWIAVCAALGVGAGLSWAADRAPARAALTGGIAAAATGAALAWRGSPTVPPPGAIAGNSASTGEDAAPSSPPDFSPTPPATDRDPLTVVLALERDALKAEIADRRRECETLEAERQRLRGDCDRLAARVREAEARRKELRAALHDLQTQHHRQATAGDRQQVRRNALQGEVAELTRSLADTAREAQSATAQLAATRDALDRVQQQNQAHQRYRTELRSQVDALTAQREELMTAIHALSVRQQEAGDRCREREAVLADLARQLAERQTALADARKTLARVRADCDRAIAERERQAAEPASDFHGFLLRLWAALAWQQPASPREREASALKNRADRRSS